MIINGNSLKVLKTLKNESVHCCVTSPPYYGLRDYGVHEQLGLEETPEQYITNMVEIFREVKRVLRSDGTLWLNIGDSYAGRRKGVTTHPEYTEVSWGDCKPKDLIGIPWMLAFALRADGWYLRQDIIWHKPNPMPESVKDRCTKSHEYIFLLSKSRMYYFDAEAIAEPVAESTIKRLGQNIDEQEGSYLPGKTCNMKAAAPRFGGKKYTQYPENFYRTKSGGIYEYRPKRNKRDVWSVTTKPYKEAHFATFPPDLIEPCVLAGCPKGGIVIDPFSGSGTTGVVASEYGREYIGIELNPVYCQMSERRIDAVQMRLNV